MVRKHLASSWEPSSWALEEKLAQNEVNKCYKPEVMENIIAAANIKRLTSDPDKQAELAQIVKINVTNLAIYTKSTAHLTKRPSPAQRRSALKKIEDAAQNLKELLVSLDGDSTDDLRRTMLADQFFYRALLNDTGIDASQPLFGRAKYLMLIDVIHKVEEWAAVAQSNTIKPKDGDRHADAKRWFVEGIIKIWIKIGYKKPTITWSNNPPKATGPLMNFLKAAGEPLGFTAMESSLRDGIALWKNEQEMPQKSPLF